MSRKHERLDAIERRLAYLEANQAGEEQDRDPRFRTASADEFDDPCGLSDRFRAALTPRDDVRERLSERTSVADAVAEGLATGRCGKYTVEDSGTWPRLEQWDVRARRYEASLMALHAMLQPEHDGGHRFDRSDYSCLIEGCLEGGVITPEGLQRAE
jgi:hypothetical protein